MKKSKAKYTDWRESVGNHSDRKEFEYLKQSNADQSQINHVMRWQCQTWK